MISVKLEYSEEIIEAIREYYYEDVILQAKLLKDLYDATKDSSFLYVCEDICNQNHICCHCMNPMTIEQYTDRHGDNSTYDEKVTTYTCKRCNI